MLTICLNCHSKHFTAAGPRRICEVCGSSRVAIASSAVVMDSAPLRPSSKTRVGPAGAGVATPEPPQLSS